MNHFGDLKIIQRASTQILLINILQDHLFWWQGGYVLALYSDRSWNNGVVNNVHMQIAHVRMVARMVDMSAR